MQQLQELVDLYLDSAEDAARAGGAGTHHSMLPEVTAFGSGPDDFYLGQEAIQHHNATRQSAADFVAAGGELTHHDTMAWAEGDFGWLIDQMTLHLADGSEEHLRLTMVCHREQGGWRWVHEHLSMGVPEAADV